MSRGSQPTVEDHERDDPLAMKDGLGQTARPAGQDGGGQRPDGRRQAFESTFTFLKVKGIPIGAHWSWLFVFALVAWTLGSRLFPLTYPGLDARTYWIMAGVAAVAFFASIVLHELGHALTALKQGVRMEGITLWLFGGVARFSSVLPSPAAEFKIAIAGPVVSFVLTIAFAVVSWFAPRMGLTDAVAGVVDYLARINGIVLAFNLVPALPLDGGRVLRAWLWHRQENFEAATRSAARAGRAFGYMLIGVGLLGVFSGAGTGGFWIAFIGWFLVQAAQSEELQASLRSAFRGLHVRDVMTPDPDPAEERWTVAELLDRASGPRGHSAYPVVDGQHRLAGFVSVRSAAEVPPEERSTRLVRDVMLRGEQIPVLRPDADPMEALEYLQGGVGRAVVVEEGAPAGILSLSDIAKAVQHRSLKQAAEPPPKSSGKLVWFVVGLAILIAGAALYHPPVALISPGPAIDVVEDIKVSGVPVDQVQGQYLLVSVSLSRPNALGAAVGLFHPEREVLPLSAVIPRGSDAEQYLERQKDIFAESRMLAAAAAATATGMEVQLNGAGAEVVRVLPGSPAEGKLRTGDVVVGIEGKQVNLANDVAREVRSRPAGTPFVVSVRRDGVVREVEMTSAPLERVPEAAVGIGVLLQTRDFSVDLPFDIEFEERDIGGPSAGLAYALAIADILDPADVSSGRTIAATGTISATGEVGPVGGLEAKAAAADAKGADLFLVPTEEVDRARGEGVPVRGVETLERALEALRTET